MGFIDRIFGNKKLTSEVFYEVGTKIHEKLNNSYALKIQRGISGDPDGNSEQEAYMEVTKLVMKGKLDKYDLERLCDSYMKIRSEIISSRGGIPRWVKK